MAAAFATLNATLASPNATSTTWTLGVDLPTKGEFAVTAFAFDTVGQQDTSTSGATARYLVYPGGLDPALSETLFSPTEGTAFTEARIFVSGRAEDDNAMGEVEVAIVNSAGQYMSSNGNFTSTSQSWRSAFLNSPGTPGSNFSYTTPVINQPACTALVCNISGVGSADPNTGDTFTYLWNFGDGTPTSTSSALSHTFPAAGTTRQVTVTAT